MGSLTTCLRKASKILTEDDASAIREIYNDYVNDGLKSSEAADRALTEYMTVLDEERAEVRAIAAAQGVVPPSDKLMYSVASKPPTMVSDISIVDELYGTNKGKMLPGMTKKSTIKDLANILTARTRKLNRGRALDAMTTRNKNIISDVLVLETEAAMQQTGHAGHWYSQVLQDALNIASTFYPEINTDPQARTAFVFGMAITSNGMTVSENSKWAVKVYSQWKRARKFPIFGTGKEADAMRKAFKLANDMVAEWGMDTFTEFLNTEFTVKELQGLGFKVNGENADTTVYGSAVFGPKIGQAFYQNLSGNFTPLTMDRWWMRTWGRIAGNLAAGGLSTAEAQLTAFRENLKPDQVKKHGFTMEQVLEDDKAAVRLATKVHKEYAKGNFKDKSEFNKTAKNLDIRVHDPVVAPRTGTERNWIREVVAEAQRKLADKGISVDTASMQALLWYPEKDFYLQNGVGNERSKPTDYAKELGKIARRKRVSQAAIDSAVAAGRGRTAGAVGAADQAAKQAFGRPALGAKERTQLIQGAAVRSLLELPFIYKGRPAKTRKDKFLDNAPVLGIYKPTIKAKNILTNSRMEAPTYLQMGPGQESAALFASLVKDSGYAEKDFELMRLFISEDKSSAFALDGDAVAASLNLQEAGKILADHEGRGQLRYRLEDTEESQDEELARIQRIGAISDAAAQAKNPLESVKMWITDKAAWASLSLVPRRYLKDFIRDVENKAPALTEYIRLAMRMEGRKQELALQFEETATRWAKYTSRDKASGRLLGELMHQATLLGVDPSRPYKPSKAVEKMTGREKLANRQKEQQHALLKRYWNKLDPEGQSIFKTVRDEYIAQRAHVEKALEKRIEETEADERTKMSVLTELRKRFEAGRVAGPYFPLARFGEFWAVARDSEGNVISFSRFEKRREQVNWVREFRKEGFAVDSGKQLEQGDLTKRIDPQFAARVTQLAKEADPALADSIWQMYLASLPEMSMRKAFMHRKGRLGFAANAIRAYGHAMSTGSSQIAKLEYSYQLDKSIGELDEQVRELEKNDDSDVPFAQEIRTQMHKRHELLMNPPSSAIAAGMTSFGFAWFLGATPAAAMVNFSQTAIVGLPVLGAEYSFTGAHYELMKATVQVAQSKGTLADKLRGEERQAMDEAARIGMFEKTQGHDLAGLGDDKTFFDPTSKMEMLQRGYSWMFHNAERINREVTFLAAYRLGRKAGRSHEESILRAEELVWDAHFDYSASNRPPIMQHQWARVITLFMNYSINITYRMARDMRESFLPSDATKEQRMAAFKRFIGVSGMTFMFAGAMGQFGAWVFTGIANIFFGGDDDEPWDAETAARVALTEMYGPEMSSWIMDGPMSNITGANVASRVSLNNLFFREVPSGLEGRDLASQYLVQVLGPLAAVFTEFFQGLKEIGQGDEWKGMERVVPKAIKDLMKSIRYMEEGVTNIRGDVIVSAEDISHWDAFVQAFGFSPMDVTMQYEQNRATGNIAKAIQDRRSQLLDKYARGLREEDDELIDETIEEVIRFNEKNPTLRIDPKNLMSSMRSRNRYSARSESGLSLPPKLDYLHDELRFTRKKGE